MEQRAEVCLLLAFAIWRALEPGHHLIERLVVTLGSLHHPVEPLVVRHGVLGRGFHAPRDQRRLW
jgi:hypothetical protein